jgi:predicted nucleic acid-binding protein
LTPVLDSMIEATALHWELTVVTRNTSDFTQAATLNPWPA